jgi:hypothetical protein
MRWRIVLVLLLAFKQSVADESMRCGSSLVTSSYTVAELLKKCGEPNTKEVRVEDVRARGVYGYIKVGETTIETWTYQRSSRALPRVVTIVDGKIVRIETKF